MAEVRTSVAFSYAATAARALNATNGAVITVADGSVDIVEEIGTDRIDEFVAPYVSDSELVVSDRDRPKDDFTRYLASRGLGFFASLRVPGTENTYLCVFGSDRRRFNTAQRYVLRSLAVAVAERGELTELRATDTDADVGHDPRDERLRLLESVVVYANDAVLITEAEPLDEPGPRICYANAAFTRTTGYALEEILGKTPRVLQGPLTSDRARERLRAALQASRPIEIELVNYRKDGTPFDVELSIVPVADERGLYTHWVSVQRDITDRKLAEEMHVRARVVEAEHAAYARRAFRDELTGALNRAYFLERLAETVRRGGVAPSCRGIVYHIDLDRFKLVNDSFGHAAGDALLVEIARRLATCVRSQDLLARMGGDEFSILVDDVVEIDGALAVAERILAALGEPVRIAEDEVFVYASIGIVYVDERYANAEAVLRDADSAMARAKNDGGMRFALFDESMHASAVEALRVQMDLRRAVERREFVVLYEPVVGILTGEICGLEALVRWDHPTRGRIEPSDFIGVAEETGLITAIGAVVLERACRDVMRLRGRYPELTLNVNVSPRQMYDPAFFGMLDAALRTTRFPPAALQLEITENVFLDRTEYVADLLVAIRRMGVRIALDDFGTGYSSLSYLERFRPNTLKIDRSFVMRIADSKIGFAIVQAIVDLARALEMDVVGEGVETRAQLAALAVSGCDLAQGYLFSRPVDAAALDGLFASLGRPGSPDVASAGAT